MDNRLSQQSTIGYNTKAARRMPTSANTITPEVLRSDCVGLSQYCQVSFVQLLDLCYEVCMPHGLFSTGSSMLICETV